MTQRAVLVSILALAGAFTLYQAAQFVRSEPAATPVAPAPVAPPPAPARPANSEGLMPYGSVRTAAPVGADAPYQPHVARRVTAAEVKAMLDAGVKVRFVDTRGEVDGPIVAGASLVPEAEIERWARRVPKSATIVVYCTCGRESAAEREVLALQRLGFRRAYALLDGLMAWESAGLPTENAPRR